MWGLKSDLHREAMVSTLSIFPLRCLPFPERSLEKREGVFLLLFSKAMS